MDTNERNEHFKGYAELLLNDLKPDMTSLFIALGSPLSSREEDIERAQRLLMLKVAQRAYDLAYHVLDNIWEVHNPEVLLDKTPDLTQWPP